MKQLLLSMAFLSLISLGFAQKKADYSTVSSQVKEAKENGDYKSADSIAQEYVNNYLFKLKEEDFFTQDNLLFISEYLKDGKAVKLFIKQPEKVNAILGVDYAQYAIKRLVNKTYLPKDSTWKVIRPNWDSLEKNIMAKFGSMGQERVFGSRMEYYLEMKDWINFGKYYVLYFKKALERPDYHINNITWSIFENVNDPKVLKFACDVVMKYAMETWYQNEVVAYDTYANLLYKTGKKDNAIAWEEKALRLAKGNEHLEKLYTNALDKMKNNLPTWIVPATN